MFKKIFMGYASVVLASLRFLALMAVCIGAGFLVVYPLWKLASSNPALYTLIFSVLLALLTVFFAGKRIRAAVARDSRRFFLSLLRKITLIAGIGASVILVFNYQRTFASVILLVTLGAYGFLAFALPQNRTPGKA